MRGNGARTVSVNVLAISAHPDDETLGCGGTLLQHRAAGDALHWIVVTEAPAPQWPPDVIRLKADEVHRVAEAYGMQSVAKLGFPAARLDQTPQAELIGNIHDAIAVVRPHTVYLVHRGDVHSDHRAVFDATMSVLKPFHLEGLGVRRVLSYETLSSTDAAPRGIGPFEPNVFVDVTPQFERKLAIMAMYESEVHPDPMPRGPSSIRALARARGATVAVQYAEAFMLVREIFAP